MLNRPTIIDIRDPGVLDDTMPVRKLIHLVLLVAAKDGASEVRFEPVTPGEVIDLGFPRPPWSEDDTLWTVPAREEWDGCRLRYRVAGVLRDMVPSPCPVQAIRDEVLLLAGVGPAGRWVRGFLARLGRTWCRPATPPECRVRLLIGGKPLEVLASLRVSGPWVGEAVILYLLEPATVAEEAARVLEAFSERWRAGPG
jgi:hypothetical protein